MHPYAGLIGFLSLVAFVIVCGLINSWLEKRSRARKRLENRGDDRAEAWLQSISDPDPAAAGLCPRHVCTRDYPCCPRECVEEPKVTRLVDGSQLHEYSDGLEVYFDPSGRLWDIKVSGRTWN